MDERLGLETDRKNGCLRLMQRMVGIAESSEKSPGMGSAPFIQGTFVQYQL
jgi:hypothetical protein